MARGQEVDPSGGVQTPVLTPQSKVSVQGIAKDQSARIGIEAVHARRGKIDRRFTEHSLVCCLNGVGSVRFLLTRVLIWLLDHSESKISKSRRARSLHRPRVCACCWLRDRARSTCSLSIRMMLRMERCESCRHNWARSSRCSTDSPNASISIWTILRGMVPLSFNIAQKQRSGLRSLCGQLLLYHRESASVGSFLVSSSLLLQGQ
jgi:hypothetical protein